MRVPFSSLWSEFRAFAFKGNMIDLAVAVVIGAAFSGVIDSLVKDIIMPSISYVTTATKQAAAVAQQATAAVGLTSQPAETQPTTAPATQPTTAPAPLTNTAGLSGAAAEMKVAIALALAERAELDAKAKAEADAKAAAEKKAADDKKKEEEKPVDFSWKVGRLNIGNFAAALLNFMIIAFAVFLTIVKLLGSVVKKVGGTPAPTEPTTKECPECLSVIPIKAKRCSHCASPVPQVS